MQVARIEPGSRGPLFQSAPRHAKMLSGRPPMHRNDVLAMVKRRCAAAGLALSFSPHAFRTTGATLFVDNSGDLSILQASHPCVHVHHAVRISVVPAATLRRASDCQPTGTRRPLEPRLQASGSWRLGKEDESVRDSHRSARRPQRRMKRPLHVSVCDRACRDAPTWLLISSQLGPRAGPCRRSLLGWLRAQLASPPRLAASSLSRSAPCLGRGACRDHR